MKDGIRKSLVIAGLAVVLTSFALAQDQGGPGGPPPPQGRQGGRIGGPGMMGGGPMLIRRPDVQKELKLTQDQKDQIGELLPGPMPGGPDGPPPPGGFGGPPPGREGGQQGGPPGQGGGFQRRGGPGGPDQHIEQGLKKILTESQLKRFKELQLQFEGPMAIARPDVSDKLGLTDDQKGQIQEILESNRPQFGQRQGGNDGPPSRDQMEEMRKKMDDHRQAVGQKILAVLSADQKTKWQSMLGSEFKFEKLGPPRGRGGGGPDGGGN